MSPLNNLPDSRNTVVQRNISGPTARKWSKRTGRVTTCETPSHHAGRAVGAERERGRRNRPPRSTRSAPDDQPADPAAPNTLQHTRRRLEWVITAGPAPHRPTILRIAPGKRIQASPNNLSDEEDSSEQVAATLVLRVFKTIL